MSILKFFLPALGGLLLIGCAGLTGITHWKERTLTTSLPAKQAFRSATVALSRIGKIQYSDASSGTITGECAQNLDAAILISAVGKTTTIIIKSKLNINESSMVIETGDRDNCLDSLEAEFQRQSIFFTRAQ